MIRRGGRFLFPLLPMQWRATASRRLVVRERGRKRERERVTYLGDIRLHYALGRKHAMLAASRSNNKYYINYSTLVTNVICQTILILGLQGWGGGKRWQMDRWLLLYVLDIISNDCVRSSKSSPARTASLESQSRVLFGQGGEAVGDWVPGWLG